MAALSHAPVFTDVTDSDAGTTDVFQDINNALISHATLIAAGFGDTDECLLIVDVVMNGSSADSQCSVRIADTAGAAVANSQMRHEMTSIADRSYWCRLPPIKVTKVSGEGFVLQKAFHNGLSPVTIFKASIVVLNLSELTPDDDYVFGESVVTTAIPASSSGFSTFATITTPSGDGNWNGNHLVLAGWIVDVDDAGTPGELRFEIRRDTDGQKLNMRLAAEDDTDFYGGGGIYVYNNPNTDAHSYDVRLVNAVDDAADFDHKYSSIVAFRASLFEDFKSAVTDGLFALTGSTFEEIQAITPFTPATAGDFLVLAYCTSERDTAAARDDNRIRVQIGGTNVPIGWSDANNGFHEANLGTDTYCLNVAAIENLAASLQDIDLDGASDGGTAVSKSYRVLVALSMELAAAAAGAPLVEDAWSPAWRTPQRVVSQW